MAAAKAPGRDLAAEVAFLTRALKAPALRESAGRLAERARAEAWSHEEFLVACLQREAADRLFLAPPGMSSSSSWCSWQTIRM